MINKTDPVVCIICGRVPIIKHSNFYLGDRKWNIYCGEIKEPVQHIIDIKATTLQIAINEWNKLNKGEKNE